MLDINAPAELKAVTPRKEIHGDEMVRALSLKMTIIDVDIGGLDSACPDLALAYGNNADPTYLKELYPFTVHHKIDNVDCSIKWKNQKAVKFFEGTVKAKMQITPKQDRKADVVLTLSSSGYDKNAGVAEQMHGLLFETVKVSITEKQVSVDDMEQDE